VNAGSLARRHGWVHIVTSLALAGLGVGVGCSDGGGGGYDPIAAPPIAAADYCAAKANAYCGVLLTCCQQAGFPTDSGKCHDAMLASCQSEVSSKQAAGRTYDAKAAGICLGGLPNMISGCKLSSTSATATTVSDACDRIWVGSVPVGGACGSTSECAASPDGAKVTCSTPPVAGDGGTTGGSKCLVQPVAKLGEPCGTVTGGTTSYVSCETGLSCQYVAGTDGGVGASRCVQLGDVGAACQSRSSCKTGLRCDAATQKCAQPATVGATCTQNDTSSCVSGAYCEPIANKCASLPGAGSPCITSSYPQCAPDSTCDSVSKNCLAKKANGQACTSGSQCVSGYCGGSATSSAMLCNPDPGIATPNTCAVANGGAVPG
jgi:hypothetical protein